MLTRLYIKNYALISQLDIEFGPGFSVITGETGAGKSIILGAMGLLLGDRADSKSVKPGCDRCVIEGHFDLRGYGLNNFFDSNDLEFDEADCILRRELSSAGKSRAFINDTPVNLGTMRELGDKLIDIHSQHQNLLLKKDDFQLSVVDIIADDTQQLDIYREAWKDLRDKEHQLDVLRENIQKSRENEDYIRFRFQELSEARLVNGEQEELEQESEMLTHAEEIKSSLYQADELLDGDNGIIQQLRTACQSLQGLSSYLPLISDTAARLDSCYIELKDIGRDINSEAERLEVDPRRLEMIDTRLDTLYSLQQKYHVSSVEELIDIRDDYAIQIDQIEHNDSDLQEMEAAVEEARKLSISLAGNLHKLRLASAKRIEKEISCRLVPLGIENARFEVRISDKPLSADGGDRAVFFFSANKNIPPQPVTQVASGGEIARVMLSLKALISSTVKLPTIVFDEIDTGVSGKTAEMMGRIMEEMGRDGRQVISITHLPQIAARGLSHYKVYKEETDKSTESRMTRLTQEQRIQEIAQMLSGSKITTAALENAVSLLSNNK